jgi:hypothetical protein
MAVANGILGVAAMVLAVAVGADAYERDQDLRQTIMAISTKADATDAVARQASAAAAQAVAKADRAGAMAAQARQTADRLATGQVAYSPTSAPLPIVNRPEAFNQDPRHFVTMPHGKGAGPGLMEQR